MRVSGVTGWTRFLGALKLVSGEGLGDPVHARRWSDGREYWVRRVMSKSFVAWSLGMRGKR